MRFNTAMMQIIEMASGIWTNSKTQLSNLRRTVKRISQNFVRQDDLKNRVSNLLTCHDMAPAW